MQQLNPQQQAAVRHIGSPLLVLAGAGSGKTGVISHKIAYLVEQCDLAPQHIAAVTFTNKAAREMKERVGRLLKHRPSRGLRVSTFHNLGLHMLQRDCRELGYKPGFSIFDAQDSEGLIRELLRKSQREESEAASSALWRISAWKSAMRSPEQVLACADNELEALHARLYADYQRHLHAYNAVDFDDLILLPTRLLQSSERVLQQWRGRIRYLLVDEYQDTNQSQYELVKLLVGERGSLTVVGDDDQSIYAWRGARPENLAQLQQDFPSLKVIKLEQNYRSSNRILHSANQLIAHNPHLFDKRLWSEHGPGEPIRVIECRDEEGEAQRVVGDILQVHHAQGVGFGSFAVLFRGNHQARPFEKALREQQIPYFLSGGTSFFARAEIKDCMAYLRLLANPEDDAAFLRIINSPRREIGPTSLEKLAGYARQRGVSLLAACSELGLAEVLQPQRRERLQQFAHWLEGLAGQVSREPPVSLVRRLLEQIDYAAWLKDTSSSDGVAERRLQNLNDLISWLQRLHDKQPEQSLIDLVNKVTLLDVLERQEEESGGDKVHLMTLHAAKGLEFDRVYLIGMEEELLPHRSSIEEDNIEEERRLAYVGITRARKVLNITLAKRRRRFGETYLCEPSRFLAELPEEHLEWQRLGAKQSEEERKAQGSAHLAGIRAMLSKG
ncbi:MAG: DNA helicase Rep [Gammaproteobacteria bacterium]|nr:DNA helicase Rep [Gammaproteobacteria bacterium]